MDELRSSEALEREIRDDSRKKAERLFKQAEEAMRQYAQTSALEAKAEIEDMRKRYAVKAETYRTEVMARLPMDRKRKRIEWAQGRLDAALQGELSRIDETKLLSLMLPALKAASGNFGGKDYSVSFSGLGRAALASALQAVLPDFSPSRLKEAPRGAARGISVATSDGRISFSLTEDSIREDLTDGYRQELVQALLGKVDDL